MSNKPFYGWRLVSAAFGLQFLQSAFMHQSFGAYVAVLRESLGWSKTALAGAAAIQQLEGAILGPIQGWLIDRFGVRGMLRAGVLIFGSGLILLSQMRSLGVFYLAFVLIALGTSFAGFFPLTITLVHWFERQRARALSILTLGFALGGVAVPLVAWCLVTFGWRATALGSGVVWIVVGWPLSGMIHNKPRDIGQTVDGEPEIASAASASAAAGDAPVSTEPSGFTAPQALRTSAFWYLSLGHGFALLVIASIGVHAITHLKEGLGYTIEEAALVIGLQTAAQVGGIVLGWFVGDRYDKRYLSAACMLAHMVGLLLLAYAVSTAMLVAFAILNGIAWGMRGPMMNALRADYFGRRSIGLIIGLSAIIVTAGQVFGPLFAGATADATGSYRLGFTVLALMAGVGSAFFLLARKPSLP